ncbi:hypothetical protein [Pediococcus inopinatus]|uniref:hypothetical protein n=1 Tax=Pediococcus inopinatus TaxID=114090 RepID=UPI0007C53830|nr:hypothetical protein [Pediococcus inopinatus]
MPETLAGRKLIAEFLNDNDISIASLATTYDVGKMYMQQVLSGKKKSAAANKMILKIIDDYKIRAK